MYFINHLYRVPLTLMYSYDDTNVFILNKIQSFLLPTDYFFLKILVHQNHNDLSYFTDLFEFMNK